MKKTLKKPELWTDIDDRDVIIKSNWQHTGNSFTDDDKTWQIFFNNNDLRISLHVFDNDGNIVETEIISEDDVEYDLFYRLCVKK